MQKKMIAAAVAGALALPVTAIAQTSTVQIYGKITYEYGVADQGTGRSNVDFADTPGGSAIGFRGEEKLGGGLSAWFQCESSADIRGFDQVGFCSRNSAVGFKGGFGNVFFGRWDTPLKRAMNVGTVGAEETGILGMSFLAFGGSGGSQASIGSGGEGQQRQRFKRREAGLVYYETPNFGGFTGMAAFSSAQTPADLPTVSGTTNDKPRVLSIAGTYTAGPLGIGIGYEKHDEFGAQGAPTDLDDHGFGISAAYTWGPVKIGATWLRREFDTAPGRELRADTATFGVDWAIAGPHSLQAQYTWAGDSKGNSLVGIGGNGGASASRAIVGGTEVSVSGTGADALSIAYSYAFSKRTRVKFGYVRYDNESNTARTRVGNTAALLGAGQNVDAWAAHISHAF